MPVVWPRDRADVFIAGWLFDENVQDHDLPSDAVRGLTPPAGSRRHEWLLGRMAVRQAAENADLAGEYFDIGVSQSGAPTLRGSTWKASITHTAGVVLAAVAPTWVGIDVERADRDVSRLSRALLESEQSLAQDVGTLSLLVAKESVAKATTAGLGGSIQRWPVIGAELGEASKRIHVGTPLGSVIVSEVVQWRDFLVGIALIPEHESIDAT